MSDFDIEDAEAFLTACRSRRTELVKLIDYTENWTLELWDNDTDRCVREFSDDDRATLVAALRFWLEKN